MAYRNILGWIGRGKRRECAQDVTERLAALLASSPEDSTTHHQVAVTEKRHLRVFSTSPLGQPSTAKLRKLTDRVRIELHRMGYFAHVDFDYITRGRSICHIGIHAQLVDAPKIVSP